MSWLGLSYKGTEPLYSDEWNRAIEGLDILYAYVSAKLDRIELLYLKSDIIPDQDASRNLGTKERSWDKVHAYYGYFKGQVYVQGKAVIKDGDPIRIEAFIDDAKTDVDKIYSRIEEIANKIERRIAQLEDGTVVSDNRFAKKIEEGYGFMASKRFENVPADAFFDIFFENPPNSGRRVNIVVIVVELQVEM